jgi:hypothetical protein
MITSEYSYGVRVEFVGFASMAHASQGPCAHMVHVLLDHRQHTQTTFRTMICFGRVTASTAYGC